MHTIKQVLAENQQQISSLNPAKTQASASTLKTTLSQKSEATSFNSGQPPVSDSVLILSLHASMLYTGTYGYLHITTQKYSILQDWNGLTVYKNLIIKF
ncbi:Uncharacterised protein [Legionella maceachernii]|nr:Uncharacterised protein [Legionella maceachernii]